MRLVKPYLDIRFDIGILAVAVEIMRESVCEDVYQYLVLVVRVWGKTFRFRLYRPGYMLPVTEMFYRRRFVDKAARLETALAKIYILTKALEDEKRVKQQSEAKCKQLSDMLAEAADKKLENKMNAACVKLAKEIAVAVMNMPPGSIVPVSCRPSIHTKREHRKAWDEELRKCMTTWKHRSLPQQGFAMDYRTVRDTTIERLKEAVRELLGVVSNRFISVKDAEAAFNRIRILLDDHQWIALEESVDALSDLPLASKSSHKGDKFRK
jgi:hypothetical protein